MRPKTFLRSVRVENFKAVKDGKTVTFTPLTVLIGHNGSGKSSLIEALETYRTIVVEGLDAAMGRWFGIQHVWNKRARHQLDSSQRYENPIRFTLSGRLGGGAYRTDMRVNARPGLNGILIQDEEAALPRKPLIRRTANGEVRETQVGKTDSVSRRRVEPGESALPRALRDMIAGWQFLSLMPDRMGGPSPRKMTANGRLLLNRDGSNLAQYLLGIRNQDSAAFDAVVESMKVVLDYAGNFEPVETQEIQRTMYVQMREGELEIPGWMLSTGTVRILAYLAVLRNPDPPPLIVIEELENGLDPRTIHLLLDEIRDAVRSGRSQVIVTTHSPYFLDLVPLQTLVLVERREGGEPVFWRPSDHKEVQDWAKRFAPGQLYTTGRFRRGAPS